MKPSKDKPTAKEFGALRAHLAKLKWSQAEINAAIGRNYAGQTRAEIVQAMIAYSRSK